MTELEHLPKRISVRLHWDDGHVETLGGTIGSHHYHCYHKDAHGVTHRFRDSGKTDEEGYRVFVQDDGPDEDEPDHSEDTEEPESN